MVRLGIYPRPVMVRRDVAGMINLKLCLGRDRAVVRIVLGSPVSAVPMEVTTPNSDRISPEI